LHQFKLFSRKAIINLDMAAPGLYNAHGMEGNVGNPLFEIRPGIAAGRDREMGQPTMTG
jgi:hypothetical protein